LITKERLRGAVILLLSLFIASQVFAQNDVIEKRRIFMEQENDAAVTALVKAAKEKQFTEVEIKAKGIKANMDNLLDLFPKGSLSEKSRAKAEIWEKWDEFTKQTETVKKAAQALADAAKAKDEEGVNTKMKALGDGCTSCHRSFRAPRKSS
jgi:cytochrome c556